MSLKATVEPIKTRRGLAVFAENPFLVEPKTRTKRIANKQGNMMLINGDGEIKSHVAGFWHGEEVDSEKFVKLFAKGVRAFAGLSSPGAKVFEVLYIQMQKFIGKDSVFMAFSCVNQSTNPMSDATYQRGMKDLVENGFIAAAPDQGWFWINPAFVWNGDRLAFIKEYKRVDTPRRIHQQTDDSAGTALMQELATYDIK